MLMLIVTVLFLGINLWSAWRNYQARQWTWFALSAFLSLWMGYQLLRFFI
jgi:hypothetical protein